MGTFDLTVVSHPSRALSPQDRIWLSDLQALTRYDVDLLKPALLFSDTVRLLTTRQELIDIAQGDIVHATAQFIPQYFSILRMAIDRDPAELEYFGIPDEWLPSREEAQRRFTEVPAVKDDPTGKNSWAIIEQFLDDNERLFERYTSVIREKSYERLALLTSEDIVEAERSGIVTIEGWAGGEILPHEIAIIGQEKFFNAVMETAAERITASRGAVMFEPGSASHFAASIPSTAQNASDDHFSPDRIAISAFGMLPGLQSAPITEVLDIREDLSDYLAPFRAAVLDLSDELRATDSEDPQDALAKINRQWHQQLNPALAEIHNQLKRGRYRRHVLEEFASAKGALSTTTGTALAIAGGTIIGGLAALIPGVAGAAYPFLKALDSTLKDRDEAHKNRLYFLYAAKQRLAKYAR